MSPQPLVWQPYIVYIIHPLIRFHTLLALPKGVYAMDKHNTIALPDGTTVPSASWTGAFQLTLRELTAGKLDTGKNQIRGATGTAWLKLPCAKPHRTWPWLRPQDIVHLKHEFQVVDTVLHPQTEISFTDARHIEASALIGDHVSLDLPVSRAEISSLVALNTNLIDWWRGDKGQNGFLVSFADATIAVQGSHPKASEFLDGEVVYPVKGASAKDIEIAIDGFTLLVHKLRLSPNRSSATASVQLPGGLADAKSCGPAMLDLGTFSMSSTCEFFIDAPERAFGPWLLADTGLIIEGTGYLLDLSTTQSPSPWSPGWRGLQLQSGTATGENTIPEPNNSGYLRGHYAFTNAILMKAGLFGDFHLTDPVTFTAINPLGQEFHFEEGWIRIWPSKIMNGELRNGWADLPPDAVCDRTPGNRVRTPISALSVQPDMDLAGEIHHGGREIGWGELTNHGDEVVAWSGIFNEGWIYLPAGPCASYSPVASGTFEDVNLGLNALAELETHRVAGITFPRADAVMIFSPDRPGGRGNPIKLDGTGMYLRGWIRVGVTGVDGEFSVIGKLPNEELGEPAGTGYVGNKPFTASLFTNKKERISLLAQFVTSAGYDSNVQGEFELPTPTNIPSLDFAQMKFTSTACLVGGDLLLPTGGVPLDYWDVQLVPNGLTAESGVISVRTGRILLTSAGIAEPLHFAQPFGLTWGELLADGNLGKLFLNFNNWGQRFDDLVFNPQDLTLSKYDPAVTDPYLGVFGSVSFPFFGLHDINIRDATDLNEPAPHPRHVTVPKAPLTPINMDTNLALAGAWHDVLSQDLAVFDCLDANVDYNVAGQYGFMGRGDGTLGFLHSDPLEIQVEIHSDATDIRFTSSDTHDLDLGLVQRLGGMSQIAGNARIEGPTLARITLYGMLETSSASGSIFGPKAGFETEINISVTPSTFNFYASGDMLVAAAAVEIEASATVHLLFDFANHIAEGELYGRVDCDAAVAGLSGEGQLTWHISPVMQYLQGRVKVEAITPIVSGGLEGGLFIGNNVPKTLAWVLDPTNAHFGMSRAILPDTLTGIFGYGQASFGVNYYVLGGGVDIYLGAGAFSAPLTAGGVLAPFTGNPLLPYVVGTCGVYVHGEILGGLVSASGWANLSLRGPVPLYFEGTFGLRGCVAWVLCASVSLTAGVNETGFYLN